MKPRWRSTEEAKGVSQVGLRSHSDNHLASPSWPASVFSHWVGWSEVLIQRSRGRRFVRSTPLDVGSAGHQAGPSLIWCHKKVKRQRRPFRSSIPLVNEARHRQDDTVKTPRLWRKLFESPCLPITSRTANTQIVLQTWSSDYYQMWIPLTFHWNGTHLYKYTNTQTGTGCAAVASTYTKHPPQWAGRAHTTLEHVMYLLHSNLPFGFDKSSFVPQRR